MKRFSSAACRQTVGTNTQAAQKTPLRAAATASRRQSHLARSKRTLSNKSTAPTEKGFQAASASPNNKLYSVPKIKREVPLSHG